MTEYNIRRRLIEDGESEYDIDERLAAVAEQRSDEARDRAAEEHCKEKAS